MKSIAEEIREGIRESVKNPTEARGRFFESAKTLMTKKQLHDRKKKFLNEEESLWWISQNINEEQQAQHRAYKCERCPFWHLTTRPKWEK